MSTIGFGDEERSRVQGKPKRKNEVQSPEKQKERFLVASLLGMTERKRKTPAGSQRCEMADGTKSMRMRGAEGLQAALGAVKFGETAAFLLDEVILGAANAFCRGKNTLPVGDAFAEQDRV